VILTVAAYKGGVAKTTTALHVADALARSAPTLLIDRERIGGSYRWWEKGSDWRFEAVRGTEASREQIAKYRSGHIVVDTPAAPTPEELESFAGRSDLVIVPTTPDALALDTLLEAVRDLRSFEAPFRVVLTIVPPWPSRQGEKARALLERAGVPMFETEIPRAAVFQHAAKRRRLVESEGARAKRFAEAYLNLLEEVKERA
jgi:chromosome partitioning protein